MEGKNITASQVNSLGSVAVRDQLGFDSQLCCRISSELLWPVSLLSSLSTLVCMMRITDLRVTVDLEKAPKHSAQSCSSISHEHRTFSFAAAAGRAVAQTAEE